MAEPVRAIQAARPIRLEIEDVRFEGGTLWQPRYESLIDYDVAPEGFQFEPAFVVDSQEPGQELHVVFGIADTENVEFYADPEVRWDCLALIGTPEVSVQLLSPRSCQVAWRRSGKRSLLSLRIACRHPGVEPTDALDRLEGGVYLVILDPDPSGTDPGLCRVDSVQVPPESNPVSLPKAGTIRLLGFDELNRPMYDLFCGRGHVPLPPELAQEPAFRAAHGQQLDLTLALDPPEARFQVDEEGEPVLSFFVNGTWRVSLVDAAVDAGRKACTIQWHRPEKQSEKDTNKSTTSFNMFLGTANGLVRIDPTVIEPPACDANGVCSPPRSWGGGSAG